jgi:uncharacterized protein
MKLNLHAISFDLLPEKAIYRAGTKTLVVADLHLGKAMHFRKSGISIPQMSADKDYEILQTMIKKWQPEKIILLGDLFHSELNSEWILFSNFINSFASIEFILVVGNHDILNRQLYRNLNIKLVNNFLEIDQILFSHIPIKSIPEGKINVAGHIHPGILLRGMGKQNIRLACFYYHKNQLILPAFGNLTGLQIIKQEKKSEVFVIIKDKVVKI